MPNPSINYKCPRCEYSTPFKKYMKAHLYKKKPCPNISNLELTDMIREKVLSDHIYHKPVAKKTSINIQNNILYSTINQLNPTDKLIKYLDYNDTKLIGFGDQIENKYEEIINNLDNDKYKYGFKLDHDDILKTVDTLMQSNNSFDEFNVLFNQKLNQIHLFHDGDWDSYLMESGVKEVIRIIKEYYLESYEKFMIRKIVELNFDQNNKYCDQLSDYYRFLILFDQDPYVSNKINDDHDEWERIGDCNLDGKSKISNIIRFCKKIYNDVKDLVNKSDINKNRRLVADIIKKNTINNIHNLNTDIIRLINMDDEFRQLLVGNFNHSN